MILKAAVPDDDASEALGGGLRKHRGSRPRNVGHGCGSWNNFSKRYVMCAPAHFWFDTFVFVFLYFVVVSLSVELDHSRVSLTRSWCVCLCACVFRSHYLSRCFTTAVRYAKHTSAQIDVPLEILRITRVSFISRGGFSSASLHQNCFSPL